MKHIHGILGNSHEYQSLRLQISSLNLNVENYVDNMQFKLNLK
jgi:hypothetical protein